MYTDQGRAEIYIIASSGCVLVLCHAMRIISDSYDSRCNRLMYVVLTWFHADMYFSMHWVKQVCSLFDSEAPGFGTHFSKQCSLIFSTNCLALSIAY